MSESIEVKHFSHKHHLKRKCIQTSFQCDGCKELGFGSCYQCKKRCNFRLHNECALLDSGSITHPFFKKCHFTFHESPSHIRSCVACGKEVKGFMYQSSRNEAHVLHPRCLKLAHNRTVESDDHGVMKVNLIEKLPHFSTCLKCTKRSISKNIKGWAYVSDCRNNYRYHVACVKDMFSENLNNLQLQPTDGRNRSIFSLLVQKSGLIGKTVSEDSWRFIISMVRIIISLIFGVGDPMSIILTVAGALQN